MGTSDQMELENGVFVKLPHLFEKTTHHFKKKIDKRTCTCTKKRGLRTGFSVSPWLFANGRMRCPE